MSIEQISIMTDMYSKDEQALDKDYWKLKHTNFGRSELQILLQSNLIEKHDYTSNSVTYYELSETGEKAANFVGERFFDEVDRQEAQFLDSRQELMQRLPDDTDEEFTASDYDLIGQTLQTLSEGGYITTVEENRYTPNVWRVTEKTRQMQRFFEEWL